MLPYSYLVATSNSSRQNNKIPEGKSMYGFRHWDMQQMVEQLREGRREQLLSQEQQLIELVVCCLWSTRKPRAEEGRKNNCLVPPSRVQDTFENRGLHLEDVPWRKPASEWSQPKIGMTGELPAWQWLESWCQDKAGVSSGQCWLSLSGPDKVNGIWTVFKLRFFSTITTSAWQFVWQSNTHLYSVIQT